MTTGGAADSESGGKKNNSRSLTRIKHEFSFVNLCWLLYVTSLAQGDV